jgi:hypothetical protein
MLSLHGVFVGSIALSRPIIKPKGLLKKKTVKEDPGGERAIEKYLRKRKRDSEAEKVAAIRVNELAMGTYLLKRKGDSEAEEVAEIRVNELAANPKRYRSA